MVFDLVALVLLALFAFLGSRRGAVAAGTGLAALIGGYAAAVWFAASFGGQASQQLGVAEILGPPIAGSFGFLLGFASCSLLGALLRRFDRQRLGELPRSSADRSVGGLFGFLRGSLIVVLLSLLALWVDAARQFGVSEQFSALPSMESSHVARASGAVVGAAIEGALVDAGPVAGVAGQLVARPADTLLRIQNVMANRGFVELQADSMFWKYIQHGAIDNAMNRASFFRLSQDEGLRQELADLALVSPEQAASPREFRRAIGEALAEVGPRLQALNEDRSLERLADDPEIVELLQSGDTFALITHPKIRAIVERVTAEL
jgi:membrane protein required for colicin V production